MNKAVELASEEFGISVKEFTVMGVPHESLFAHHWFVGTEDEINAKTLGKSIAEYLKKLNDDYAVERKHALKKVKATAVPSALFYEWMKLQGKEGGQNKFPRVLKGERRESWIQFLISKGIIE